MAAVFRHRLCRLNDAQCWLAAVGCELDQVPTIAINVFEHRYGTVGLVARRLDEADAPLRVGQMVTIEVVRLKEQEHSAAALIANCFALPIVRRLCQQEARLRTWRRYNNPSLLVCQSRVLTQFEAELIDIERYRLVIVIDGRAVRLILCDIAFSWPNVSESPTTAFGRLRPDRPPTECGGEQTLRKTL
jgi:hypothetical protein